MTDGTVIKFGGSLMDIAGEILSELPVSPILIVPGGGIFADFVRAEEIDDDAAHWKAIDAMEKYGRFLSTFGYPVTSELVIPKEPTIFLPKRLLQREDPLPHTWDITSDSISAWIAGVIKCRLLVIKSADSETDLLDSSFLSVLAGSGVSAEIINGRIIGSVRHYFEATRL
ncbi:MAG: uridylate kinase [Methanocorpusculum sp.]|jgi:hypothetical protein|uniref:uridylate kinase n=1 Tax=Methanocorpusculum sp. TaxID=2058474 RepID=UPI00271AF3BF|nr:uridylate kinase [Methanocorpusculum sp.]MDO9523703.1 uridylate kinase [Methanocorpusculum sp.]